MQCTTAGTLRLGNSCGMYPISQAQGHNATAGCASAAPGSFRAAALCPKAQLTSISFSTSSSQPQAQATCSAVKPSLAEPPAPPAPPLSAPHTAAAEPERARMLRRCGLEACRGHDGQVVTFRNSRKAALWQLEEPILQANEARQRKSARCGRWAGALRHHPGLTTPASSGAPAFLIRHPGFVLRRWLTCWRPR